MGNMQFHWDSQIWSTTLSYVKSYQLLKVEEHSSADSISGKWLCSPRLERQQNKTNAQGNSSQGKKHFMFYILANTCCHVTFSALFSVLWEDFYGPKMKQLELVKSGGPDIYLAASRFWKYPALLISTSVNYFYISQTNVLELFLKRKTHFIFIDQSVQ